MTLVAYKVIDTFKELFEIQPKLQDKLVDLKIDSLDIISLVQLLEQKFEIEIPDRIVSKFLTVKDVVTIVETLENKKC